MNAYNVGVEDVPFPQMDLSGKLIIKAQLGDDIRRIPIHNDDITYDELQLMMQRVFRTKLTSQDDVTIKYKDEDGDLITIFDSSDLSFAIQCSRILKLTIFVNGIPRPIESSEVQYLRNELKTIRDRVLALMDHFEPSQFGSSMNLADGESDQHREKPQQQVGPMQNKSSASNSKEFDPLTSKVKAVQEEDHRSGTPDSVSSRGSSAGHGQAQRQNVVSGGHPTTPEIPQSQNVVNPSQAHLPPKQFVPQQQDAQQQQQMYSSAPPPPVQQLPGKVPGYQQVPQAQVPQGQVPQGPPASQYIPPASQSHNYAAYSQTVAPSHPGPQPQAGFTHPQHAPQGYPAATNAPAPYNAGYAHPGQVYGQTNPTYSTMYPPQQQPSGPPAQSPSPNPGQQQANNPYARASQGGVMARPPTTHYSQSYQ